MEEKEKDVLLEVLETLIYEVSSLRSEVLPLSDPIQKTLTHLLDKLRYS